MPYSSVFKQKRVLYRKDFCAILNLDPDRELSEYDINRAYRLRSILFHPDRQARSRNPLPKETCTELMIDITKARDCLLLGIESYGAENNSDETGGNRLSWLNLALSKLDKLEKLSIDDISVPSLFMENYLVNDFMIALLSSLYKDNKLGVQTLFELDEDQLTPVLNYIHSEFGKLATFLELLKAIAQMHQQPQCTLEYIKNCIILNRLTLTLSDQEIEDLSQKIHANIAKIQNSKMVPVIEEMQRTRQLVLEMAENFPSWRYLIYQYVITLLFTSTNIPNFMSTAAFMLGNLKKAKGDLAFYGLLFPYIALSACILPINALIQLSTQAEILVYNNVYLIYKNLMQIGTALIDFIKSPGLESLKLSLYLILEAVFNSTIRLSLNFALDVIDEIWFYPTRSSLLGGVISAMNLKFDAFLNNFHPETGLVVYERQEPVQSGVSGSGVGFFAQTASQVDGAEDDPFLAQVYGVVFAEENMHTNFSRQMH